MYHGYDYYKETPQGIIHCYDYYLNKTDADAILEYNRHYDVFLKMRAIIGENLVECGKIFPLFGKNDFIVWAIPVQVKTLRSTLWGF